MIQGIQANWHIVTDLVSFIPFEDEVRTMTDTSR